MSHRLLAPARVRAALTVAALTLAALTVASPALAQGPESVTATGTAEAKVVPANRHSNASIVAAVAAAEKQAVPGALDAAHANALIYAEDAGLTLGAVQSVSDAQTSPLFFVGSGVVGDIGTFGPGKYCGTVRSARVKRVNGKIKVIRGKKRHVCDVPANASSTLTVTYAAS